MADGKGKVVEAEFGGDGPRQVLAECLKSADHYRSVLAITVREDGEIELWANGMTKSDLAVMFMKLQAYVLMAINDWEGEG